jgi:uncharacterized protein (TIGR02284 family)
VDTNKVLDKLQSLAHLDIDALGAYTSAIERIDLADVREKLISFRSDHERHISDLSRLIEEFGAQPPKHSADLKGLFIQGFTAIRSMVGNEQALKAMKANEEVANRKYAEALELELPEEVRVVIQRNRDDERRHLEYIEKCISTKVWEEPKIA